MPRNSKVILHVPGGLLGVILGNVYENFKTFNYPVNENDCIVGPMCEFEFHSYDDITEGSWIKIEVPHIVKNPKIKSSIKVISRDRYQDCIEYAQELEIREDPPDCENIYYRFSETCIEIFTQHFSQFIVYAENTTLDEVMDKSAHECCSRVAEFVVFTKWIRKRHNEHFLEVNMYIFSLYYSGMNYRQVSKTKHFFKKSQFKFKMCIISP